MLVFNKYQDNMTKLQIFMKIVTNFLAYKKV